MSDPVCEVPIAEDRDTVLYTLRNSTDHDLSAAVVPALFAHFETVSLWVTACDADMIKDPQGYFYKKLSVVSAMADDANAFLVRGVPAAVCATDEETQAIGRAAVAARWLSRFAANLSLLSTMDSASSPHSNSPPYHADSPPSGSEQHKLASTLGGGLVLQVQTPSPNVAQPTNHAKKRHDVKGRWDEFSATVANFVSHTDRYQYSASATRNCMKPEHIDDFRGVLQKVEAEVIRLTGIQHALTVSPPRSPSSSGRRSPVVPGGLPGVRSPSPAPSICSNERSPNGSMVGSPSAGANASSLKDPLFYDPPLSHFIMLRDVCFWSYAAACQDFHAHLLHNQQVIFAGLKMRLSQITRAVPIMKTLSPKERKAVFEALDQLHYDCNQFLNHLQAEAVKANARTLPSPVGKCVDYSRDQLARRSSGRSWLQMLFCQPEVAEQQPGWLGLADERDELDFSADRAASCRRQKQRAKTMQLLSMTAKLVSDTSALRQQMDRTFSDEYASGVSVRASRAATRMLHWAQSATVVFGPPITA